MTWLALVLLAGGAWASSHREAPLIARDPLADNTDLYAFVSPEPGRGDRVVLISNWIPLEKRESGPNFWGFDDEALYDIRIDGDGDAFEDISYQFRFTTTRQNLDTFLYNTGPVGSLTDPKLNVRQTFQVVRTKGGVREVLGSGLAVAPAHVGTSSMAQYAGLRESAIHTLPDGSRVFAGPRAEMFYIDLGAVFDLLQIRTVNPRPAVNATRDVNVHTIALELPKPLVTKTGAVPGGPTEAGAVIGVWSTTHRRSSTVIRSRGRHTPRGSFAQVSRLGMPLFNELVVPVRDKDRFNASHPRDDATFLRHVTQPELPALLSSLFGLRVPPAPRTDLVDVFLNGLPGLNQPANVRQAELMRLNIAIPPTPSPNRLGALAGDRAGFPNGRRPGDDVVDIALRVMAGVLLGGFDVAPNKDLTDGVDAPEVPFLETFPFLPDPHPAR
jgi:hypothetical protein